MKLKAGGIIEWYAGALLELFGKGGRWSNTSKKKKARGGETNTGNVTNAHVKIMV